jgi:hypothetical protein
LFGDVNAHTDQAFHIIEPDSLAGEEIGDLHASLGQKRRLHGGFPLLEYLFYPLFQKVPVGLGKELERMHGCDFCRRIAGDPLEIPIPPEEAALIIIKIHDAGHAFDHRVGKLPLAEADGLGLSALLVERQRMEGERDVGRRFGQQGHLLVEEVSRFVGVDGEHAADLAFLPDRERRRGAERLARDLLAPGQRPGVVQQVLADA